MKYIYDQIFASGNRILVSVPQFLKCTEAVKEDFWCEYDSDISDVPEHIANISYILNIAPVVWALNVEARVRVIDYDLCAALPVLRDALRTMYPALPWQGSIVADETKLTLPEGRGHGIFFSGGLDSVFSTFRHLDEKPTLFTIRGSDISLNDGYGWNLVKAQSNDFA